MHAGFVTKLRDFLELGSGVTSDKAEVIGQIMTRRVQVVSASRSLALVVPLFSSTGHHHIPVVDEELRLIGILTQTDVVRALLRHG